MSEPFPRLSAEPISAGRRIACRVEYNGACFNGWQSQPHPDVTTVQQVLEAALARVADAPVRVHCAGRTDSGVHAHGQVVHFEAPVARAAKSWVLGANAELPREVRLHWAVAVDDDFHARFSALSRRYRYLIASTPIRTALLGGQVTWHRYPLDAALMHQEAQVLLGEQDFSAFRAASCQSTSPMRDVQQVAVFRRGDLVVLDIRANAFLHHMVRNIAGSLMAVGSGRQAPGWLAQLLQGRDRTRAADTAAPDGLYLVEVTYPGRHELPPTPEGPLLLGSGSGWA